METKTLNAICICRHVVHSAPITKVIHTPIVPAVSVVKTAPIVHGTYLNVAQPKKEEKFKKRTNENRFARFIDLPFNKHISISIGY